MADKRNILPAHKARQKKIAGRKIGMPPLNHHHIRLFAPDIARCSHDIERIRRMEPVLRILYFETVVTVKEISDTASCRRSSPHRAASPAPGT